MALSPERQSARMSETENGKLGVYGTEHSKCNHLMTLGFKGLMLALTVSQLRDPSLQSDNIRVS